MKTRFRGRVRGVVTALVCATAVGCEDPVGLVEAPNLTVVGTQGVKLVTLRSALNANMEALHVGRVDVSFDGCIRTSSTFGGQTVVWPAGYSIEASGDTWAIRRASGETLGLLGTEFTFGGGIVEDVTEALGFTAQDQATLQSECPGRYWIVGEVP